MLSLSFLDIEAISDWISLAYLPPFFFLNEKRKIVLALSQWALETEFFWEACYGSCPPRGIPFGLSGLKCTGKESHILDCEHEPAVSRYCGKQGYSYGSGYKHPWDIVGVECTNDPMIGK